MQIVIPQGILTNDREPVLVNGIPVLYCRVAYLGGEIRVPNPEKIPNGTHSNVALDVRLQASGKTYRDKASGFVSGGVAHEVKFERVASVAKK